MKLISIVIPIHNEEPNINPLYNSLRNIFDLLKNYRFEVLFVDDGSQDKSIRVLDNLVSHDKRIKIVEFSRNFGKEMATSAGIHEAIGDAVIMMDADMQHPPELIPNFIKKWEEGSDVVVGLRSANQNEGIIKKLGSYFFYKILGLISETKIIPKSTDFRLIDKQVVEQFRRFSERSRITRGLIDWLGFKPDYIEFKANPRTAGTASYSPLKLFKLALASFISHSLVPLKLAGYLGVLIIAISGPLGLFILIEKYMMNDPWGMSITGSATLGVILMFLVGIILSCLGLIALYIGNIHLEVNNRPMYVIRRKRVNENLNVKLEGSKEPEEWGSRSADRRDIVPPIQHT
jgi:glycosyltransferase involved in cell wall biosynthesis